MCSYRAISWPRTDGGQGRGHDRRRGTVAGEYAGGDDGRVREGFTKASGTPFVGGHVRACKAQDPCADHKNPHDTMLASPSSTAALISSNLGVQGSDEDVHDPVSRVPLTVT